MQTVMPQFPVIEHPYTLIKQRRQQFLDLAYYNRVAPFRANTIEKFLAQDWHDQDTEVHCGEASRWSLIASTYFDLFFLHYTAGRDIKTLEPLFEQAILYQEKKSAAYGEFYGDSPEDKQWVIGGHIGYLEGLQYISLCILLHRFDLIPRVRTLIYGTGSNQREFEDSLYNQMMDFFTGWLDPNVTFNSDYFQFSNALYEKNTAKEAVQYLQKYLKGWYDPLHADAKDFFWYNSHLYMEDDNRYYGYWSFEAAAAVYLLNLKDDSLHKFLYYPKDLVTYARSLGANPPPIPPTVALGAVCKSGEACPQSGVWQVQWSSSTVEYEERKVKEYPEDKKTFNQGEVFPDMPLRFQRSDWRTEALPVKWALVAHPMIQNGPKVAPVKPVRLPISTTCKTGEVCGQKGIWQALWPSGTVEHTSRSAVSLAQVPVDFPQDFYTFEVGDVFPKMPLTYESNTWAIHKTPITWQLVAYQLNETYKHSTVYVEVDEPENTQPAKHPMQGRRFTSGDVCPCDADYRPLPYAEHEEVIESKRHIKKGEVFPEMMVRHTKPREVIIKTGLFSKKTEQEFDYLDKVVWRLHPDEIDNYRG